MDWCPWLETGSIARRFASAFGCHIDDAEHNEASEKPDYTEWLEVEQEYHNVHIVPVRAGSIPVRVEISEISKSGPWCSSSLNTLRIPVSMATRIRAGSMNCAGCGFTSEPKIINTKKVRSHSPRTRISPVDPLVSRDIRRASHRHDEARCAFSHLNHFW